MPPQALTEMQETSTGTTQTDCLIIRSDYRMTLGCAKVVPQPKPCERNVKRDRDRPGWSANSPHAIQFAGRSPIPHDTRATAIHGAPRHSTAPVFRNDA